MSEEVLGLLRGVATVLAMAAFVGVVAWAWSRKRAPVFDAAAQAPLQEDVPPAGRRPSKSEGRDRS
jgi:cytochrome c oxidase cbb3-type subunit 4